MQRGPMMLFGVALLVLFSNDVRANVLVVQDGEVIYEGGVGPADATWGIPNAPDVRYGIGSVTKVFTALLVMRQVERGALRLDAPAARYLPDFPTPLDDRITVERLLTTVPGSSTTSTT